MKSALLVAASMLVLATSFSASAQDRRDGGEHRFDNAQQQNRHFNRGERLPDQFRGQQYRMTDYRTRGWRAPPRGYAYYRTDSGDTALALIATGVIASVIADGQSPRYNRYGRPY